MDGIELFGQAKSRNSPLADRMRPQTLDDIVGQDHIVGSGRLLRRAIQADRLSSVIFYGPPGVGKTSLARVIANTTKSRFESLNAVLSGVKDIRETIDRACENQKLYSQKTILFVDEVHRWNKAQQDALLPWVENGTVILVGATTENPFFEVNRALVSRSRIFQLKQLDNEDLKKAALRAVTDKENGYGKWKVSFEEGALEHLIESAAGDARSLLNALELAVETSDWKKELHPGNILRGDSSRSAPEGSEIFIGFEAAQESIQKRAVLYDRDGDYHFDTISAFIKSVRGSDPDAALYWLAKMVRAGEDPAFIFRRMIILASEDIGLADPHAITVVTSCAEAFRRIGFPEGNYPLAHACLYLSTAPKSNSAMAFFDALAVVDKEDAEVPNHLRDPSRDKEGFGHGEGYQYPHAYKDHWKAQQYLPSVLRGKIFYTPGSLGYEKKIREEIIKKREIQAAVLMEESENEKNSKEGLMHWLPDEKKREHWYKRLENGRAASLIRAKDAIFAAANPGVSDRTLLPFGSDGLLVWESLRRSPIGLTAVQAREDEDRKRLLTFAASGGFEKETGPVAAAFCKKNPDGKSGSFFIVNKEEARGAFGCDSFDHILIYEPLRFAEKSVIEGGALKALKKLSADAAGVLQKDGDFVFFITPPKLGERLSRLLQEGAKPFCGYLTGLSPQKETELFENFARAENSFFEDAWERGFDAEGVKKAVEEAGFSAQAELFNMQDERLVGEADVERWFNANSRWGAFVMNDLGAENFLVVKQAFSALARRPVLWKWRGILVKAVFPPAVVKSPALFERAFSPCLGLAH
ncbi:MAG: AAA family ATPase [Spirochaetaceae bacterium]|jgi:putative ATPase|nr:AAA family ATPase [Spirochaetaceae bacterium]